MVFPPKPSSPCPVPPSPIHSPLPPGSHLTLHTCIFALFPPTPSSHMPMPSPCAPLSSPPYLTTLLHPDQAFPSPDFTCPHSPLMSHAHAIAQLSPTPSSHMPVPSPILFAWHALTGFSPRKPLSPGIASSPLPRPLHALTLTCFLPNSFTSQALMCSPLPASPPSHTSYALNVAWKHRSPLSPCMHLSSPFPSPLHSPFPDTPHTHNPLPFLPHLLSSCCHYSG